MLNTVTITAVVQGGKLVLTNPVELPDGTVVSLAVTPCPATDSSGVPERVRALFALPAVGMWADREDMADSVAWVNEQRTEWDRRSSPQD